MRSGIRRLLSVEGLTRPKNEQPRRSGRGWKGYNLPSVYANAAWGDFYGADFRFRCVVG
jgi:hypothetical protein